MPALTSLTGLSVGAWLVLAACALLIGFAKTGIGGVAMVAVVLAALVLPTRDSTGVVLVMLLTGDLVAVWTYRHDVDWRLIGRLAVPVLAGIGVGSVFLTLVDPLVLRRTIAVILLVLLFTGVLGFVLWPIIVSLVAGVGALIRFPELLGLISRL